ncbi:hypothetical protein D4764_0289880 [Takifugu flavidus]|uniref:Uncharacterized protein n=1 Tax=Takifugu flavidus TaxID=433684 RepID=A0A5C6MHM7_9TELE|nr:hypothetical protein D4764_0289880 [Takifugu flavidus]
MELKSLELLSKASLRSAQEKDEVIGPAIKALKTGCWPSKANLSKEVTRLKREAGKLSMKDGLLYRYSKRSSGETVGQMVLPKEFREMVMRASWAGENIDPLVPAPLSIVFWYSQAFPIRSQKAPVVAKVLMEKYFVHYGLPSRIHSDQGLKPEQSLVGKVKEKQDLRLRISGVSDSSSDMEYYITNSANRKDCVPRVTITPKSVVDTEPDPETELDDDTEKEKDIEPEPVNENISDLEEDDQEPDLEPECERNEEGQRGITLEETSETGSESDQEEDQNRRVVIGPEPRLAKPTIRLTYDEPGKSRDQPLTIVHRGIVIKTGKH